MPETDTAARHSPRFQQYLNTFQSRVEARYANATYPAATGLQGKFDPANGTVDKYSSDVMIPAFLAAYTGGGDINSPLDIFPSLARMLPNWTVSYKGLATCLGYGTISRA